VDVRGGVSTLPVDPTLFPAVPSGTLIPTSGLGVDVGGHVYLMRLGPARVGIGANFIRAAGRTSQQATTSASGSATTAPARPDVETRLTTIAPQLSLNFGSADGWSYLSAGIGPARVRTTTTAFQGDGDTTATRERSLESESLRDINFGGGARWFTNRHFAISFDVRFHVISGGSGEAAVAGATLVAVSAGISLK